MTEIVLLTNGDRYKWLVFERPDQIESMFRFDPNNMGLQLSVSTGECVVIGQELIRKSIIQYKTIEDGKEQQVHRDTKGNGETVEEISLPVHRR